MTDRLRITILGAGFAGLETAFLLRMRLRDRAAITLVSEREAFTFRPNAIYVPFGADPSDLVVDLAKPFHRRDVDFVQDTVTGVDPEAHEVQLEKGRSVAYDKLVIATGAGMSPDEIPGLSEHAATIWTPQSMLGVRERFERVRDDARAGTRSRVLFLVPPNNKCAGPLYEIVMMFETWLRRQDARRHVDIAWSTFEQSYIQAFGPRLHDVISAEFAERDIEGRTGEIVTEIADGEARYADGTTRAFDHLIAFPPYVSAVRYDALPSDERGFIETDTTTRQVAGHADIYAPGDAGDFPVKQAFLAFLQADTVAEHIAAAAGAHAFEQAVRPGFDVHHGDVRQGDLRAGAAPAHRRSGTARHGPPRRRRRLQGRYRHGVAPRQEDARRDRADALSRRRAVPRRARLADDGGRPQRHVGDALQVSTLAIRRT